MRSRSGPAVSLFRLTELRSEEPLREARQDDGAPSRLGITALAQDTAIYGGTRVLLKSLAFLLVPLYAHFLDPAEFGQLELVLATVAFVDVLIAANMDGVVGRFFFDRDDPMPAIAEFALLPYLYRTRKPTPRQDAPDER